MVSLDGHDKYEPNPVSSEGVIPDMIELPIVLQKSTDKNV